MIGGVVHTGSTGCDTKAAALRFEKEYVRELRRENSAKHVIERYHRELTGGQKVALDDAWERFLAKPRRRPMGDARRKANESRWDDFLTFLRRGVSCQSGRGGIAPLSRARAPPAL